MSELTSRQIVPNVLLALKETARDVDERRVRLDGRVSRQSYTIESDAVAAALAPVSAK